DRLHRLAAEDLQPRRRADRHRYRRRVGDRCARGLAAQPLPQHRAPAGAGLLRRLPLRADHRVAGCDPRRRLLLLAWPPIQSALVGAGEGIAGLGAFGTFLYGFLLRLSGAVGLHHMIYPMFWYTPLGGTETVAGTSISGAQNIFFAQ